jgi:hypothetical protein
MSGLASRIRRDRNAKAVTNVVADLEVGEQEGEGEGVDGSSISTNTENMATWSARE